MTCTNCDDFYPWVDQTPLSFTQWKTILSRFPIQQPKCFHRIDFLHRLVFSLSRLFSSPDHHTRSLVPLKKPDRSILPRNQVFNDGVVDSFLVSSTLSLTRQGIDKQTIQISYFVFRRTFRSA